MTTTLKLTAKQARAVWRALDTEQARLTGLSDDAAHRDEPRRARMLAADADTLVGVMHRIEGGAR